MSLAARGKMGLEGSVMPDVIVGPNLVGGVVVARVVDRDGVAVPEVWDGGKRSWVRGEHGLLTEILEARPLTPEEVARLGPEASRT
jgi:hypothetical protein